MSAPLAAAHGAMVVMSALAALFFLRYWWLSKDRFFIWFASAFATFAVSWTVIASGYNIGEHVAHVYVIRLLGFLQIIIAIVLKNTRPPP